MGQSSINTAAGLLLAAVMSTAGAAPLRPQQLQADLQLARRALEETHGGIYRYSARAVLDRAFDAAAAQLNRPMEAAQFHRILAPAVAAVRCGHTAAIIPAALKAELERALLLPLDVKLIDGRIYILRDFDSAGRLAGREIVSVNGVATSVIVKRIIDSSHGDGFIATSRERRVARRFKEELFLQFGMQGKFSLALRGAAPGQVTLAGQTLPALKAASASRYPEDLQRKGFARLSLLDEGRTAHLQIFNFSDEDEDDEGAVTLKKMFDKLAASGAKTLLLDLRDNGGGEDALGKRVFSYLVQTPFPYYESLTVNRPGVSYTAHVEGAPGIPETRLTPRADGLYALSRHPNLGLQMQAAPAFTGKVIALINGDSFSTTAELITQLHDKRRATFVGEESGGAYHGNTTGSSVMLVLPNSGAKVVIPLVTYTLSVSGKHANGRGVVPEVKVTPTIGDYLRGKDVVLEKALHMARAD